MLSTALDITPNSDPINTTVAISVIANGLMYFCDIYEDIIEPASLIPLIISISEYWSDLILNASLTRVSLELCDK